jgi:hypothetical protein
MPAIHYILHNLIEVAVDKKVNSELIDNVEFQLGHFKTRKVHSNSLCRVDIVPYGEFLPDYKHNFRTLYSLRGISGSCLDDPENRLAVEKRDCNFHIYTDKRFIPINLFIQLILVELDISLLAAAAVADLNGRVTLFPGAGGAGKSVLAIRMVKDYNYRLLGDDTICMSEQGNCLSFPRAFLIKEYDRLKYANLLPSRRSQSREKKNYSAKAAALKIAKLIRDNLPFLGVFSFLLNHLGREDLQKKIMPNYRYNHKNNRMKVPVSKIVGSENISDEGSLERVVYLQRYKGSDFKITEIDKESILRRTIAALQNEWALQMRLFYQMGLMEMVDIPGYFDRVAKIIRTGLAKKDCSLLMIPENASPDELVNFYFNNLK